MNWPRLTYESATPHLCSVFTYDRTHLCAWCNQPTCVTTRKRAWSHTLKTMTRSCSTLQHTQLQHTATRDTHILYEFSSEHHIHSHLFYWVWYRHLSNNPSRWVSAAHTCYFWYPRHDYILSIELNIIWNLTWIWTRSNLPPLSQFPSHSLSPALIHLTISIKSSRSRTSKDACHIIMVVITFNTYDVATMSRLLKFMGLFCKISSLL